MLCPLARYIYLPKNTGNTQGAVAPSQHDKKLLTGMQGWENAGIYE